MEKTNAMRILDKQKIEYLAREYDVNLTEGKLVAQACGLDGQQVFKTLVTVGASKNNYVFVNKEKLTKAVEIKYQVGMFTAAVLIKSTENNSRRLVP